MAKIHDLLVIGVGTAASTAARKCAREGWSVAVCDHRPYGGTCPLRGCDPKKILRRGAEILDAAARMQGKGIGMGGLHIDWAELVAFKRSFVDPMPETIESSLDDAGVATLHGRARFVSRDAVEVNGERMEARHFLIATGALPRPLDIKGAEHLIDSSDFMELESLPRRILFVGGGYISYEFAHMAARAGSEVTILSRSARPLKAFDPDLVDMLVARGEPAGVRTMANSEAVSVEKAGDGFVVTTEGDGGHPRHKADLVVHGAGRVPDIGDLNLDAAGIEAGKDGISVQPWLQSVSNPAVFAAGDVAATEGAPLTPVASLEGETAAANMLSGNRDAPDYTGVPSVVFTLPPLARVGMLESEAREHGHDVRVSFSDTGSWYSNVRIGEDCAAAKVVLDETSGTILGAHLLGPDYDELINFFGFAMRLGLDAGELKRAIAAYPSAASDLGAML